MKIGIHEIPDMIKDDDCVCYYYTISLFQGQWTAEYFNNHKNISVVRGEESGSIYEAEKSLLAEMEKVFKDNSDELEFYLWMYDSKQYIQMG
jgi:hypothetical protein